MEFDYWGILLRWMHILSAMALVGGTLYQRLALSAAFKALSPNTRDAWFQAVRKKFAEMLVRTYMLDSVIYRTVGLMDERIASLDADQPGYNDLVMAALEEYAIEASISKILGSETLFRVE